jgi:hypothetical protein
MAARAAARCGLDSEARVRLVLATRGVPDDPVTAGPDGALGLTGLIAGGGVVEGTGRAGGVIGLIVGGGIAGTLAALPMPLGSLTEPLNPRAFAGPGGMPLTPASWPGALAGTATTLTTATLSNATLPSIHPRKKIETSCARLMDW